ncbi:3-deoxy-D-manno-octulosonate 8-phosphate phosphatase, YrbI family [Butyrivibrio fibrisolvens 16/4]|jgi:3-deoxy-D-manno-octulosonate 8-phosphate phosphatase (KDO 8-P phosphatase)|nr:3-deoxy-D-manno-octulosonate 8-phosphate phosphatase, YrbI family [Butyrivibrio fibrisolvens 16/4]
MKDIKYLVLDVDGTLTDGCVYMGETGELCKAFNIKDGYGIVHIAAPAGIIPIIITGRKSDIVLNRCKELGITNIHQGVSDKLAKLKGILSANGGTLAKCAYMGDDLNDMTVMEAIKAEGGLLGCPADAAEEIIGISDYVSKKDGGRGAVREFIEWLVK